MEERRNKKLSREREIKKKKERWRDIKRQREIAREKIDGYRERQRGRD